MYRFFSEKITAKKEQEQLMQPKPINAIEDFCARFDRAVRNSLNKVIYLIMPAYHTFYHLWCYACQVVASLYFILLSQSSTGTPW